MNCPHCFQQAPDSSAFCPNCGARLAEPDEMTALEATQDPTYGALAHANLMRLRGDWDAARDKIVSVMREFPNSGTAHSLMGDIYADQQLYEDASQWYRMALDLEPKNAADARKLAAAQAHLKPTEAPAEGLPNTSPRINAIRVAAIAAMAFLVFAISLGFYVKTHSVPQVDLGPTVTSRKPGPEAAPVPRRGGEGTKAETPGGLDGGVLPGLGFSAGVAHSHRESEILSAMSSDGLGQGGGVMVTDVAVDPRDETATVTMSANKVDGESPDWMAQVYAAATGAAVQALQVDHDLSGVTVRVVMPLGESRGVVDDVAFIGEMKRSVENPLIHAPSEATFTRRWWCSGLQPPPALASTIP